MPPVKRIDLSRGLEIICSGSLGTFSLTSDDIGGHIAGLAGNIKKKEARFNEWLNNQEPFVTRRPLSDFPPEDPIHSGVLSPSESIDGDDLVTRRFYAAVHVLQTDPLEITLRTSNDPIGGDWWL